MKLPLRLQNGPPPDTAKQTSAIESGRGQPHSKTLRNQETPAISRQRLGVRQSSAALNAAPTPRALANVPACCALAILLLATGCRRDMFHQPSSKPLERSEFFQDNQMASRPIVAHTVARGQLQEDEAFYTGKIGTNLLVVFPMSINRDVLVRGQERFNIYCSPCHGRTGEGNGMIPQRGFPPPPSYHIDRLRQAPVGHFFDVITHGYGVMYPYAARVEPQDRWAIAAYIRVLQASRNGTIADVPEQFRAQLESPQMK